MHRPSDRRSHATTFMRSNFTLCFIFAMFLASLLRAEEDNAWPVSVRWSDGANGAIHNWILGPFGFSKRDASGRSLKGLRPVFVVSSSGDVETGHILYPFFNWRTTPDGGEWDLFKLLRWSNMSTGNEAAIRSFELWPFYLSRDTGDPATSYRALMPIAGTVKDRFGHDRINWAAFPFYGRFEQDGVVTTTAPWPFIKVVSGDGTGFEFWPVFGRRSAEGRFKESFALWPVYHHNERVRPEGGTSEELAILPFYSRSRSDAAVSETFLWPFFGYTDGRTPRYREQRWFWPFVVTARGDDRRVDRFAPLYTHSERKGTSKTWVMWPLLRDQSWTEAGLEIEKTQLLYFLYWRMEQRSVSSPSLPAAHKTHVWPLLSKWDNGAGHKQVQLFSPFEVFFQHNETVRTVYTPLFSIYRLDQRPSGDVHSSFLFNLMTYHREGQVRQFNLGPILETVRDGDGLRRVTLLKVLPLFSRKTPAANQP